MSPVADVCSNLILATIANPVVFSTNNGVAVYSVCVNAAASSPLSPADDNPSRRALCHQFPVPVNPRNASITLCILSNATTGSM